MTCSLKWCCAAPAEKAGFCLEHFDLLATLEPELADRLDAAWAHRTYPGDRQPKDWLPFSSAAMGVLNRHLNGKPLGAGWPNGLQAEPASAPGEGEQLSLDFYEAATPKLATVTASEAYL